MITKFPCSGEINFKVADTQITIQKFLISMLLKTRKLTVPMV